MRSLHTVVLDGLYVSMSNKIGRSFPLGADRQTDNVILSKLVDVVRTEGSIRLKLETPLTGGPAERHSYQELVLSVEKG